MLVNHKTLPPRLKRLSLKGLLAGTLLVIACATSTTYAAHDEGGHDSHDSGHTDADHGQRGEGRRGGGHDSALPRGHHGGGAKAVENRVLTNGGRPVWAQGGIPEVELGRLNAARAPGFVLERALEKAHEEMTANPEGEIHSPPQNIALYREAVLNGDLDKAASFLGSAAEKRMPITGEMVEALNIILAVSVPDNQAMANEADQIRQAILEAHDAESVEDSHH